MVRGFAGDRARARHTAEFRRTTTGKTHMEAFTATYRPGITGNLQETLRTFREHRLFAGFLQEYSGNPASIAAAQAPLVPHLNWASLAVSFS